MSRDYQDETAKLGRRLDDALAQYQPRPVWADKGGKLPPGLDYFHNLLCPPGPFMQALKRKPKRPVKLWSFISDGQLKGERVWFYSCRECPTSGLHLTWDRAYENADHHARNHHGEVTR